MKLLTGAPGWSTSADVIVIEGAASFVEEITRESTQALVY